MAALNRFKKKKRPRLVKLGHNCKVYWDVVAPIRLLRRVYLHHHSRQVCKFQAPNLVTDSLINTYNY